MNKPKARLENWKWHPFYTKSLMGNVFNHPNFKDGEEVTTSSVQHFDEQNKKAFTRNTEYELGERSK